MTMITLLLASLAIGSASGQEDAAIIAPIKPIPVPPSFTCATVLCIVNSTCVMYEALDGKMKPYCLPIDYKNRSATHKQQFPACAYTKCKLLENCVMVEVTCVKAPCYPVPECRPRPIALPPIKPCPVLPPLPIEAARKKRQTEGSASGQEEAAIIAPIKPLPPVNPCNKCPGKNQVWSDCGSACPKRCEQKEPVICPAVCRPGCVCKKGFCFNKLGQCVPDNNCGILTK
ncbi:hypothetical protein B9Z55_021805 [Caenorhabditis nigoni]|uniref:TIL domain-containing protein n=1 Tax=Caenorhabditis nigoni TaxID=1611254 RepID=A0A2G5TTL9_9PELO|nr:hypothetical protein B9Z55_021805 [Caenorhabditis nigoni]